MQHLLVRKAVTAAPGIGVMPQQALAGCTQMQEKAHTYSKWKKYGLRTKAYPIYLQNTRCTKPSIPLTMNPGTEEKWVFYSPAPRLGLELFILLQQNQNEKLWELQENHCFLAAVKIWTSNKRWKFKKIKSSYKLYAAIIICQVHQQVYIPAIESMSDFRPASNHPFSGRESNINWDSVSHLPNIPTAWPLGLLQHERGLAEEYSVTG